MQNKNFLLLKIKISKNIFFRIFLFIFLFLNLFFLNLENIFSDDIGKKLELKNIWELEDSIGNWILPFWDLDLTHPAKDAILELYRRNIITWYNDQTFRPDNKISRAEFVKIVLWATNCTDCTRPTEEIKTQFTEKPFWDIQLWDWFHYCVSIWKDQKIITWYLSDWLFRPHKNISRWEAVAILLRKTWVEVSEYNWEFYDVKEEYWFKDYIKTAVEIWLISQKNWYVGPLEEITRWEFALITSNLLSIHDCREGDSDKNWVRDFLEKDDWIWEWKWGDVFSDNELSFLSWLDNLFLPENLKNNLPDNTSNLNNRDWSEDENLDDSADW